MGKAITRIHVNQHHIRENAKTGDLKPVFTIKKGSANTYSNEIEIEGRCRLVYSPDKPLSCGAKVWIEVMDEHNIVAKKAVAFKDL